MPILGKVLNPVVGLTAEAMASRKDKSTPNPSGLPGSEHAQQSHHHQDLPPRQHSSQAHTPPSEPPPEYTTDDDYDEAQWELDDAAIAAEAQHPPAPSSLSVPKGNAAGPASVEHLVAALVSASQPLAHPAQGASLAQPVILPQRRPRSKARGFVRAYSPALADAGIPCETWLRFLTSFDEALRLSPVFNVINIAASVAGLPGMFLPSPTLAAVTTAIQAADAVAQRTYARARTNGFLERANRDFWMPQGLFCLVMTYKPQSRAAVETLDLGAAVAKRVEGDGAGKFKTTLRGLRNSDGVSKGAMQLPPAAPLVYPAIDRAVEEEGEAGEGWFKRKGKWVSDYLDRRAQASYGHENEGDALGMRPEFKSKWGDPATYKDWEESRSRGGRAGRGGGRMGVSGQRGGGWGAADGGDAFGSGYGYEQRFYAHGPAAGSRFAQRGANRRGGLTQRFGGGGGAGGYGRDEYHNESAGAGRGRGGRGFGLRGNGPLGMVIGGVQSALGGNKHGESSGSGAGGRGVVGIGGKDGLVDQAKKALRPDVLYLMVVPMPSAEELAAAREVFEVREE